MSDAERIVAQLRQHGFRVTYRTLAVSLLVHPGLPGVEVRVGTIYLVATRDGREVYRALHRDFRLDAALGRLRAVAGVDPTAGGAGA